MAIGKPINSFFQTVNNRKGSVQRKVLWGQKEIPSISSSTAVEFKLHGASALPGGLGKYAEPWAPASESLILQIWVRPSMHIFDKYDQVNNLAHSEKSNWGSKRRRELGESGRQE